MLEFEIQVLANLLDEHLDSIPLKTKTAARIAINDVSRQEGLRLIQKDIGSQVAFPDGYLTDPTRLGVSKLARNDDLEAVIRARSRPTSLARFTPPGTAIRLRGQPAPAIKVTVKPGNPIALRNAFLLRLKRGSDPIDPVSSNIGLAIRLKPGETLPNKTKLIASELADGVYILYGPSVDQVFAGVSIERSPELAEMVATEFVRQFDRLETYGL